MPIQALFTEQQLFLAKIRVISTSFLTHHIYLKLHVIVWIILGVERILSISWNCGLVLIWNYVNDIFLEDQESKLLPKLHMNMSIWTHTLSWGGEHSICRWTENEDFQDGILRLSEKYGRGNGIFNTKHVFAFNTCKVSGTLRRLLKSKSIMQMPIYFYALYSLITW